jgi:hypothetical protein
MAVLDPEIWGPHFWFFINTLALNYPNNPNDVTKKKYYEFIQNLPLFIPVEEIANDFDKLLKLYPVSSYLDSKKSFVKWVHFIHNKINEKLEKPKINLNDFYNNYYNKYKKKDVRFKEFEKWKMQILYAIFILGGLGIIIYYHNK